MSERLVAVNGTTTSTDEDIMTFLKTKTNLASSTEDIAFRLTSCYFESSSNTGFNINGESEYSDLKLDLNDGLYRLELKLGEISIKTFVIEDIGVSYYCKFTY